MPGKRLSLGLFLIMVTSATGISRLPKRRAANSLLQESSLVLQR